MTSLLIHQGKGGHDEPARCGIAGQRGTRRHLVMATAALVTPSPQARTLFNTMALVAQPYEEDDLILHVDLAAAVSLACRRQRNGLSSDAGDEVAELLDQAWIREAPDGGWLLP
jgi:hypothetical protein